VNVKTATLIALIVGVIYTLFKVLVFLMPSFRYGFRSGPFESFIELAFPASITFFFFALYSRQKNS
jgi:hypothetical protein